jgi:hypothetical protein
MSDVTLPVAEGHSPRGLWCVAYRTPDDALDVLAYRCAQGPEGLELGDCVFAGRLRDGMWVSTIGAHTTTRRDVTAWLQSAVEGI